MGAVPLGIEEGVGAIVWSPLGWGRLTGKIRRGQPLPERSRLHVTAAAGPPVNDEQLYAIVDSLDEIATETGKTVPQIALNWLLRRPTASSVIIGARDESQLRDNLGAVGWQLDTDQIARLDAVSSREARRTPTSRTSARRGSRGSIRRSASVDGVAVQLDEPLIHLRVVPVVVDLGLGQLAADSAGHAGDQRPRRHRDTLRHERSRRDQ
jgi:hypothetical protein